MRNPEPLPAEEAPELLIFPFNGNGLEALDCLGSAFRLIGFVDDTPEKQGIDHHGHAVYSREAFDRWPHAMVLAVPGSPKSYPFRQRIIDGLGIDASRWARVVHPKASVSPLATVGHNVLIMAGVVITSNAVIGDHVCILPNTVVHHDAHIGDWSLLGATVIAAGHSVIGENCYIGSGSHLMNGVTIGAAALVGLGSNVVRDVGAAQRVAGNPARTVGRIIESQRLDGCNDPACPRQGVNTTSTQ
ncbi:MAG: acetyltransferase [Burkholderiales bacterium]|nr:acetyltransferase [Burkholderiales bacterium]